MSSSAIERRIGEILSRLSDYASNPFPLAGDSPHLRELFEVLRTAERSDERAQAEELIWALWCSHEDQDAAKALQKATGALNRRELDTAQDILDELIDSYPGWAEAWNKRATLMFIADKDTSSLDDIAKTLELEPRHFGAICGLGQICLRNDDEMAGLAAFQFALKINPNLEEVKLAAKALEDRVKRVLH